MVTRHLEYFMTESKHPFEHHEHSMMRLGQGHTLGKICLKLIFVSCPIEVLATPFLNEMILI